MTNQENLSLITNQLRKLFLKDVKNIHLLTIMEKSLLALLAKMQTLRKNLKNSWNN